MTISEYILHTKKTIGEPHAHHVRNYNRIFEIIKKHCATDLSDIHLDIIYSTNKTSELFYTQTGEKHLIYDQYLGQVFNMLNRLHFNSSEPEAAEYYLFKLLAEEFQLAGNLETAIICAGAYATKINEFNSYKKDTNIKDRNNYILIQETFILAHELAHYIFNKNRDPKIHNLYKEITLSLIQETYENISDIDFIDSYLTDRHNALYSNEDSYKDHLNEEQIQTLKDNFIKAHERDIQKHVELINTNNNLIEEIICDDIAVNLVLSVAEKEFGVEIEKTLDALYIGMMNLRILGIINKQVTDFEENKSELQFFFSTSMIRLFRFRDKANFYYGLHLNDENRGIEIQKKLTASNLRYSSIISDKVLFNLYEKLELIKSKIPKNVEVIDFDNFIKQNDLIDSILNHK